MTLTLTQERNRVISKLKLLEPKPLELKTKTIYNFRSPKIIDFNV
jgi:hypothetical protein